MASRVVALLVGINDYSDGEGASMAMEKGPAGKASAKKAVKGAAKKVRVAPKKAVAAAKKKLAPVKKAASAEKVVVKKVAAKTPAAKKASAANKSPVAKKVAAKKSKPAAKKAATNKATPSAKRAVAPVKKALPAKTPVANRAPPKKVATKTAARGLSEAPALDYDPLQQLENLSAAPAAVSRGLDDTPTVDVQAVLGEFFALRQNEELTPDQFKSAADTLGVQAAALRAIAQVESAGSGFDAKGRPTILYERHVFARSCNPKGKFNAGHPDISANERYAKGTFGTTDQQWPKLARAYQLDPEAALKAPSWGTFQILGENFRACGFASVREMVNEMFRSPVGHLKALVGFIKANPRIHNGLKSHDWAAVALGYNGSSYKVYEYDKKLEAAYKKLAA